MAELRLSLPLPTIPKMILNTSKYRHLLNICQQRDYTENEMSIRDKKYTDYTYTNIPI